MRKNIYLLSVFVFFLGCQTSPVRWPASIQDNKNEALFSAPLIESRSDYFEKKKDIQIHDGTKNNWQAGSLNLKKMKFSTSDDYQAFLAHLSSLLAADKEKSIDLPKASKRTLKELQNLIAVLLSVAQAPSAEAAELNRALRAYIFNLVATFNYNFQSPVKQQIWILAAPVELVGRLSNSIMSERARVANNVAKDASDLSLASPADSTFWVQPQSIGQLNLYYGFGRSELPQINAACKYKEAKKSYGTHGGFTVLCGDVEYKIKFGNETKTEPFNSRVLWALGYNVTPIDYVSGVELFYDRKILTEYNSRKDLQVKVKSIAGFAYHKHNIQKTLDPFEDAIFSVILKTGERLVASEAKKRLLGPDFFNREKSGPQKINDSDINVDFENQILKFVLQEGSIEAENEKIQSLGPWSWNDFDHPDRRELRGFSVIAGWLNMFDVRTDNNRLRIVENEKGERRLKHFISDVGSGLGIAENVFRQRNAQFNKFPWVYMKTRPEEVVTGPPGKGSNVRRQTPFAPVDYKPLEGNEAFERAQASDAKWAAHFLARLSESQITDALVASGFTAAEARLVLEKLVSRRQNLIEVLGLKSQYPQISSRQIRRELNYDPATDGDVIAISSTGKKKAPSVGRVQKGQIID